MRKITHKQVFLSVYVMIGLATLYHSSFGFGTLHGMPTELNGLDLFIWWFLGFICATAIDVGMGAVVWAMINGYKSRYLTISLLILAIFSAYSQLIYSAYHSEDMSAITQNTQIKPFMQFMLDARVIILPLCLPFFSLFYGFVAKNMDKKDLHGNIYMSDEFLNKGNDKSATHMMVEDGTLCGIKNAKNLSSLIDNVTCKICLNKAK